MKFLLLLVGATVAGNPWSLREDMVPESGEPFASAESAYADPWTGPLVRGQTPEPFAYADESLLNGTTGPILGNGDPSLAPYDPQFSLPSLGDEGGSPVPGLAFGISGPQPYRFGWTSRYDIGFLGAEGVKGAAAFGNFSVFEFNSAWRYTTGAPNGISNLIFSATPEFNYRSWSGPNAPGLPPNVFRFASDFELATPGNHPVSLQLGFTPALVTDMSAPLNGDAWNWDVRGVVFIRTAPQWMVALGAAYWQRVDGFVIPYAGVVWTPNDLWELRLMFPRSRISYFLGNWWGASTWAYGAVEYGVEAYEIDLASPSGSPEKIQLSDYRAVLGLRTESRGVTGFIEGGWVFDRHVQFLHGTPGFDIHAGLIGRIGLRF